MSVYLLRLPRPGHAEPDYILRSPWYGEGKKDPVSRFVNVNMGNGSSVFELGDGKSAFVVIETQSS